MEAPTELEERRLRKSFREQLGHLDGLLLGDVPLARQTLREVIAGRIRFTPEKQADKHAYRLNRALITSALPAGYIGLASPRGFEPRSRP